MASKNLLIKLASVAGISSIAGAVFTDAVKEADEDKMREIITVQKDRIAELQAKGDFMENTGPGMGQGGADVGAVAENGKIRGAMLNDFNGCEKELDQCRNKEMGRFMKDFYLCQRLADSAIYLKDLRSAVSCKTSRKIHELIESGLERCNDAEAMTNNEDEIRLIEKEKRRLLVVRAEKKVNPDSCAGKR